MSSFKIIISFMLKWWRLLWGRAFVFFVECNEWKRLFELIPAFIVSGAATG